MTSDMGVKKPYNISFNSHMTKYWPLIGKNLNPVRPQIKIRTRIKMRIRVRVRATEQFSIRIRVKTRIRIRTSNQDQSRNQDQDQDQDSRLGLTSELGSQLRPQINVRIKTKDQ